ncbi:energy-coupling factor transporter transmembrane component T family protein [Tuberibacillus sp. Marseille-P3662]|uniref:energy-coupling factor transporter transmembrane component T family protein n=1 Tax=Tuberibacillus sp. Marseille-P3662 TaxID=1965358 RepID=UPI000A1C9A15|nr:energy-coupling factor transporter transmembrane component T [Tuberibacillus sp. Marseille-P3662]
MKIIIGQYVPGGSIIHRLDPRAKILTVFLYVVIVFLANNWLTHALSVAFIIVGVLLSRVPLRFIYNGLKPIFILVLITFILNLWLTKTGDPLVEWGWLTIYEGGLKQALLISVRLLVIIVSTTLLTLTTTPIAITDALEVLLGPLKKIKCPVHEFALMMSISLRFIPTLVEETDKIMKAQMARGVDFFTGSLMKRAKAVIPLLVPLFVSSFKRAEDLAMAMESRGYRGDVGRTRFRKLLWTFRDTMVLVLLLALTVSLLILRNG